MARASRQGSKANASQLRRFIELPRTGVILLASVLLAGFAMRVWLAFVDDGIYWPDEVFQSIEPAHRLAFGYGLISWEYGLGARTWIFPGLLGGLLMLCNAIGLSDPREYLSVVRILMCTIGSGTALGSYVLARRLGAGSTFAACGAAFFALVAPAVYFGPKALSDCVSALPVVFGLAFALPEAAGRKERLAGTGLVALATILRLQNAVFCLALLAVFAARRRWRPFAEVVLVLGVGGLVLGLVDKVTWGGWFQSVVLYMRFTLGGGGPVTGSSPASYYAEMLLRSMPLAVSIVALLAIAGIARARALAFVIAVFFVAHVITPNKAYRYALPALPLMGALAAMGLQTIWANRQWRTAAVGGGLLLASCSWSLATYRTLTFADIGPYEQSRPNDSAFDDRGPINRLLMAASRQPDICGLKLETHHLVWTGGYSYFHRNVPLYSIDGPPRDLGFYNYVIAPIGETVGNPVAADGEFVLRRLPLGACRQDPQYDSRLPGYDKVRRDLGL